MALIKKYGNRRLYDVARSRYITLAELAEIIRGGEDARIVDAKNGDDLTTATLAQIIVESRGAARLLPAPLLLQLIRMRDDSLAEFLGQYVTWALEVYLQAKQGAQALSPFNPFLASPFGQGGFPRMFGFGQPAQREASSVPLPAPPPIANETADLRRELEELKKSLKKRRR
jgi:polyhydroxyalkanoate synthesis repressor PhaR